MKNLTIFNYNSHDVKTVLVNSEIYFNLNNVCEILELGNPSMVIKRIDTKGVSYIDLPTAGGVQKTTFINEPNLYRVIFQSRKKEAEQFQNWVFEIVLPSIRKTGKYEISALDSDGILKIYDQFKDSRFTLKQIQDIIRYFSNNLTHAEIAKLMKVSGGLITFYSKRINEVIKDKKTKE